MKISIITVSFNSAQTIQDTIESVLSQDYPSVEYIVVDGASKDGTVDILKSYGDKIKWISEPDKGIYDAMNKGLKLATGEVIGIIGSDDFYPNNHVLSHIMQAFAEFGTDSVYGDKQYVDFHDKNKIVRYWQTGEYHKDNWLNGWMIPHLAFYLKKSVYDKNGYYLTDFKCSGDYELMLRMLYKYQISTHYLPELVITMRTGGTSNASFKHRIRANKEDRRAWSINNLKPRWYTLWWKPLSKIGQLFKNSRN